MKEFSSFSYAGVHIHVLPKPMNKMINIQVSLVSPLNRATWTAEACLPDLLLRGTVTHRSQGALQAALAQCGSVEFDLQHQLFANKHLLTVQVLLANQRFLPGKPYVLSDMFNLLAELLHRPLLLDPQALQEIVPIAKHQLTLRMANIQENDEELLLRRLWDVTCPDHPNTWPLHGWHEDLSNLHADALVKLYQQMVATADLHIFVVGAVQTEEIIASVQHAFPGDNGPCPSIRRAMVEKKRSTPLWQEEPHLGTAHVITAFHVGDVFWNPPAYFMLCNLYSLLPTSRLYDLSRTQNQWVYSINTYLHEETGYLVLHTTLDWQNRFAFITACQEVLQQLQAVPITPEELSDLCTACIRKLKGRYDQPWRAIEFQLKTLLTGDRYTMPYMVQELPNVTPSDIQRMAGQITLETILMRGGAECK